MQQHIKCESSNKKLNIDVKSAVCCHNMFKVRSIRNVCVTVTIINIILMITFMKSSKKPYSVDKPDFPPQLYAADLEPHVLEAVPLTERQEKTHKEVSLTGQRDEIREAVPYKKHGAVPLTEQRDEIHEAVLLTKQRDRMHEADPSTEQRDKTHDHEKDNLELEFHVPIRGEDNIIFLETSCAAANNEPITTFQPELRLSYLQACAIESAAKTNPNSTVYLFYSCPLNPNSLRIASMLVQRLLTEHPNVRVWHETLGSFFRATPLEEFYASGAMQRSHYRSSHTSDVLRYLALWKYGGLYLDLDFIVTRPLAALGENFAGAENGQFVDSGALRLSADRVGRDIVEQCVEELRMNFRGDVWSHNGPYLITRVLNRRCGTDKVALMTRAACDGFIVQPPAVFYAVPHGRWKSFYVAEDYADTMRRVNRSHAVHLWNSKSKIVAGEAVSKDMVPGSRQPIALLRERFCPLVYQHIVLATHAIKKRWLE